MHGIQEVKVVPRSPPCHLRQREMGVHRGSQQQCPHADIVDYIHYTEVLAKTGENRRESRKVGAEEGRGCNRLKNDDVKLTRVKAINYKELCRSFQGDLKQKMEKYMMCSTIIRKNFGVM